MLANGGFLPKKYFIIHGYCAYVEVVSAKTADIFLLAIPSSYKFKLEAGDGTTFKLKYIKMDENEGTAQEYGGEPDDMDVEKNYTEIDVDDEAQFRDTGNGSMEGHLEEAYKRPIALKELSQEDKTDVKDLHRQLKRLRYCVQSIKYKLGIIYNNYLSVIDRKERIECFLIKHYPREPIRKLMVIIDLELLYKDIKLAVNNISVVRQGIHKVLDKNQTSQIKLLGKILEEKNNIQVYSDDVVNTKSELNTYKNGFDELLKQLNKREEVVVEKLKELRRNNEDGYRGMQADVGYAHQKGRLEEELSKIHGLKQNALKNIMQLNKDQEHLYLSQDKLVFDNLIMISALINNFKGLGELSKKQK